MSKCLLSYLYSGVSAVLGFAGVVFLSPSCQAIEVLSGCADFINYQNERATLHFKTEGDRLYWTSMDSSGKQVHKGAVNVKHGVAEIPLSTSEPGYFTVEIRAAPGAARITCNWLVIRRPQQSKPQASPFGVMTHFAQGWDLNLLTLIRKAGVLHVRDEVYWKDVEETPGHYNWPARDERYLKEIHNAGVRQLLPLTFENPNYDEGFTPYSEKGIAAYSVYAEKTAQRYAASVDAVEVWNEYNGGFCSGPASQSKPESYAKMLAGVYPIIKQNCPALPVVAGATAGVPLPFFERLFQAGALENLDAVSVHPYRYTLPPEGIEEDILSLRTLIRSYNHGADKPIWVTEIGWPTVQANEKADLSLDEIEQASYLVRSFALLRLAGVERAYWYLLRDYDAFQNMGLVRGPKDPRGDYAPKPALAAFIVSNRLMANAKSVEREPTAPDIYSLLFKFENSETRVLWSLQATSVELEARNGVTEISMLGEEISRQPSDGRIRLRLNGKPIFIVSSRARLVTPPLTSAVVTTSTLDFSNLQGSGGWYYGVFQFDSQGTHFRLMPTYRKNEFRAEWADGAPFASLSSAATHPGSVENRPIPTVRRWISTVSGPVLISGQLQRSSFLGHTLQARIVIDGQTVAYSREFAPENVSLVRYLVQGMLKVGSTVDFIVESSRSADVSFDDIRFTATIARKV